MSGQSRPNNQKEIPLAHYGAIYAGSDPSEISRRTGFGWDSERGMFSFRMLSRTVEAAWPALRIRAAETGEELKPYDTILLARFMTGGCLRHSTGRFLAYAEMPWGQVYNKNFEGRCIKRLAFSFGDDLKRFERACLALGGRRLNLGDSAFELEFLPGLFLRLILWEKDEEFPPSSQILFSDNFPDAFNAEDNAVVGETVISWLKSAAAA